MKSINFPVSGVKDVRSTIETEKSIVVVGPNGSGKTKLGIWLENNFDQKKVMRISAHKSLVIPESVSPTDTESAKSKLMFGYFHENFDYSIQFKKGNRWGNNPDTNLLNDYESLLTYLFSENYDVLLKSHKKSREEDQKLKSPETLLDSTIEIWEHVIPHRKLTIRSGFLEVSTVGEEKSDNSYKASSMSDGERVIFYLIGQCLAAPKDGMLVVDEPELHIHKSIQRKLWNLIEQKRTDCLFIYLTHDLEFSSSRTGTVKICLKEFDGNTFYWFPINESEEIPEDVYLEIIGGRNPVLFIEGTSNSYDKHLYGILYPEYTIKSLGSCEKVIQATKTFNDLHNMHNLNCFGIVDRDYRPSEYITSLEERNVFCPMVTEVENLFLVEEVLLAAAIQFATPIEKIQEIKEWVIEEFDKNKQKYALESTAAYINFNLNSFNGKTKSVDELNINLSKLVNEIGVKDYYEQKIAFANKLIQEKNYNEILKVFNHKGLLSQVGKFFDIKPALYSTKIQVFIQNNNEKIINAIKEYLPSLN
jgi:Protein of unknown function (DUF4435)/AAA domain, putative AbiEii toxin, Type IV TA system